LFDSPGETLLSAIVESDWSAASIYTPISR
jgi:hypothetical protein